MVKAWDEIDRKRVEFNQLRAKHYLGKITSDAITLSDDCYKVFNTHACQLGFVLTSSTLVYKSATALGDLPAVFAALVSGANAALTSGPTARKFARRTVLARAEKNPLNSIRKMDTPLAPYFRYFWLELLATPEAQEKYQGHLKPEVVLALRDEARFFYFDYVETEAYKALKSTNPGKPDAKLRTRATEAAKDQIRKALDKWFDINDAVFSAWLASRKQVALPVVTATDVATAEEEESPIGDEAPAEGETVDDILKTLPS